MGWIGRLVVVSLVVVTGCGGRAGAVGSCAVNGGFEEGWHLATTFWTTEGGPFHYQYQEITPPEDWTAWWHEGFPCPGSADSNQRRPEVRVISRIPDPTRVHSGGQATQFFTFWGCHRGGLYQQIVVEPGKRYTAQAFVHAWFSNCDLKPHYRLPLDYDCDTENPLLWAQDRLRIGLDPLGGIDPTAPSVEWSPWEQIYGGYGDPLRVEHIEAVSDTMTVILESDASHPLKHNDVYWDDVAVWECWRVYLPVVVRSGIGY